MKLMNLQKNSVSCLLIVSLIATLINGCSGPGKPGQIQSFDTDWRFYAGEIKGAERPEYNDSSWLKVDVPHDWSIEGLARSEVSDAP